VALAIGLSACAQSPITSMRVERAIAPTFANLVHTQMVWIGLPPMAASDFAVQARCRRLQGTPAGSGEWTCSLMWRGPDRRTLRNNYELFVTTDGCYTATASGENVGGPMLKSEDGRDIRNLLYAFEGCFDTT
jgi:hypothetical protein